MCFTNMPTGRNTMEKTHKQSLKNRCMCGNALRFNCHFQLMKSLVRQTSRRRAPGDVTARALENGLRVQGM